MGCSRHIQPLPSREVLRPYLQSIVLLDDDAVYSVIRELVRQQTKIVHLQQVKTNRIMFS
jgi:hypothetical protein